MNFYYHPILGLQYMPVQEIVKGSFVWDGEIGGEVKWVSHTEGRKKMQCDSQYIISN